MLMPGRHWNADKYRFGFQGQEKDDEIKGVGNSLNYKFRMHDPRIGRFFAIDPLTAKYPYYSPYAFSGNRVVDAFELEGLEPGLVRLVERGVALAPRVLNQAQIMGARIAPAAEYTLLILSTPGALSKTGLGISSFFELLGKDVWSNPGINHRASWSQGLSSHGLVPINYYGTGYLTRTDFGRRSLIKDNYNYYFGSVEGLNMEIHHIIPWEFKDHAVVQYAADAGFDLNNALENGIALKKYSPARNLNGEHANHPHYNTYVRMRLKEIDMEWYEEGNGNTAKNVRDFAEKRSEWYKSKLNDLTEELLDHIDALENEKEFEGLNLNDYFRNLNKEKEYIE